MYVLVYVSVYVFLCMYIYPSHYRCLFVVGVSVYSACVSVSMNTHDLLFRINTCNYKKTGLLHVF